ncbi:hypothetical protein STEG23_003095 [Scotinomys teguina]
MFILQRGECVGSKHFGELINPVLQYSESKIQNCVNKETRNSNRHYEISQLTCLKFQGLHSEGGLCLTDYILCLIRSFRASIQKDTRCERVKRDDHWRDNWALKDMSDNSSRMVDEASLANCSPLHTLCGQTNMETPIDERLGTTITNYLKYTNKIANQKADHNPKTFIGKQLTKDVQILRKPELFTPSA